MQNLTERDAEARAQALDPELSFIVQAPAGSGKTELLVRRYLILLSRVRFPEAIIAITFTRKAAYEMRVRILDALEKAQQPCPTSAKEKVRWQLASAVLARDKTLEWNVLANPNRLRIQTIDSLCKRLTRQMPLLSKLDQQLSPLEQPEPLYRLAAQALIASLETEAPWQTSLLKLIKHVDNDFFYLEKLLSEVLASREQWLSYLLQDPIHLRAPLEKNLQAIHQARVIQLETVISQDLVYALQEVLNLTLPPCQQSFWQVVCNVALTNADEWRKKLTKNEGFPSPCEEKDKSTKEHYTALKNKALRLISQLKKQSGAYEALIAFKNAPPLNYTDAQWEILLALFELLPLLVAHLKIVFQQSKKVDYTEILLCALAALGDEDNPSDLALSLDYQIEHLLIDEFQDTSGMQFQLIEKLTAGWQVNEGKSLFLVGDPMQSIYRFRKAEVSLFLQAKQYGIGNIPLQSLTLSVNFRSSPALVEWINDCFSQILPKEENSDRGAIAFTPATASQQHSAEKAVAKYWLNESDPLREANKIISLINQIKQKNPQDSIAILVRARTHLKDLLPSLQAAALPYHAIEIENLAENSAIQDMVALTRALFHLGDRISWLALLRSPFCGLDLCDLYQITRFSNPISQPQAILWQQLTQFEKIDLSEPSKQRCRRIVPILEYYLGVKDSVSMTSWIKNAWIDLGGPTTLNQPEEITHIESYLNYLEKKVLAEGDAFDLFKLEEELTEIVIQTNQPLSNPIHILTLYKAKGLEYDHIILPSLHRKSASDSAKLMLYQESYLSKQKKEWLLTPIKAKHATKDRIYDYLSREERQKTRYELSRLLYVASTRAKKSLSLLGVCTLQASDEIKPPPSDSLLYPLWQAQQLQAEDFFSFDKLQSTNPQTSQARLLKRLVPDWQSPLTPPKTMHNTPKQNFTYHWQPRIAKSIGTVVHRLLYQISQEGLEHWDKVAFTATDTRFRRLLEQSGILSSQIDAAFDRLKQALNTVIQDPRARWILNPQHEDAHSEYALSVAQGKNLQTFILDRTFIDANIRWIIDYKTTAYTGDNHSTFLNREMQQHKKQLENYAAAFALLSPLNEKQTMRLGLYFPLDALWHEWEYQV